MQKRRLIARTFCGRAPYHGTQNSVKRFRAKLPAGGPQLLRGSYNCVLVDACSKRLERLTLSAPWEA